jgi:hypothetical protein
VLFAFWDGEDTGEEGGTSHVVRYALDHSTPVVWFPVARSGDPEPPAAVASGGAPVLLTGPAEPNAPLARAAGAAVDFASPAARALLAGHRGRRSAAPKLPAERLARLEELCRYAGGDRHIPGAITGEMPVQREGGGSVRAVVTSVAQWIVPAYVIADGLAKRYQNWLKALNIGVYAGAAAAVSFGAAAAILLPFIHWQWLAVAEVATLLALLAVQWQDLRTKCRDRWVTYRALGEYFRIGRYLALVVPKEAHGFEYGRFARLYSWSSEPATTPWFAPVIGQVWDYRPPLDLRGTGVTWLRDYLISDWIAGQISYHEDRRDLHRRWDRRFTWIIRATLAVTLAAAIGHMLFDLVPGFAWLHGDAREVISRLLAFLAIALTSVAGAFNGYSGQQRHNYHCAHFGRMAKELRSIEESLEQAGTMTAILGHIGEVRRVTLGETTNWYEGMQAQEMDMPT